MRQCPTCGRIDPAYWHPRIFDYEIDIAKLADLPEGFQTILNRLKKGETFYDEHYAYKVTKSKVVYRMWLPIFKARGWSPKAYYDGITSPGSASYKRAVSVLANLKGALDQFLEEESTVKMRKP